MSATMARQGGRVQLEQSDMCLALNMAKMATGGFSHATIEETQYLIKKPSAEVWEEKQRGVEFPRHRKVKAAIERHVAMLHQNQTDRCLRCQNGAARNMENGQRRRQTHAPPPDWHRQPTPEQTPPLPAMPPAPPGDNEGAHHSQIGNLPPCFVYLHTHLPSTQFFNLDAYAQDGQHDKDFNPDMLTEERTSTG